jgi:hypothetical protein
LKFICYLRRDRLILKFVNLCATFSLFALLGLVFSSCKTISIKKDTSVEATQLRTLRPHLFLGLDGIPHSMMQELQKAGHFRFLNNTNPYLATFPSISDPNWSRIMKTPIGQGYTKMFFDRTQDGGQGKIVGGLIDHLKTETEYERAFDFKPDGFWEHATMMMWLETTAKYWLESLPRQYFETLDHKDTFSALIINTDLIAHTKGREALLKYLIEVESMLLKMMAKYNQMTGRQLKITLASDHGNDFIEPQLIRFEENLVSLGWRPSETISRSKDFVFLAPEILSFGAFYLNPKEAELFAKDLARTEGIEMTFFVNQRDSTKDTIEISAISKTGSARFEVDFLNKKLRYLSVQKKDPFNHRKFFPKPFAISKSDWLAFEKYESLTMEKDDLPFALVRVAEAFSKNALQPADVLAHTERGWAFTNPTLEIVTKIKGLSSIHGSLRREESLGIMWRNF